MGFTFFCSDSYFPGLNPGANKLLNRLNADYSVYRIQYELSLGDYQVTLRQSKERVLPEVFPDVFISGGFVHGGEIKLHKFLYTEN